MAFTSVINFDFITASNIERKLFLFNVNCCLLCLASSIFISTSYLGQYIVLQLLHYARQVLLYVLHGLVGLLQLYPLPLVLLHQYRLDGGQPVVQPADRALDRVQQLEPLVHRGQRLFQLFAQGALAELVPLELVLGGTDDVDDGEDGISYIFVTVI